MCSVTPVAMRENSVPNLLWERVKPSFPRYWTVTYRHRCSSGAWRVTVWASMAVEGEGPLSPTPTQGEPLVSAVPGFDTPAADAPCQASWQDGSRRLEEALTLGYRLEERVSKPQGRLDAPADNLVLGPAAAMASVRENLAHWTLQAGDTKTRRLEPGDGDAEGNGRYDRSLPLEHTP